jgi:hypothetical protein
MHGVPGYLHVKSLFWVSFFAIKTLFVFSSWESKTESNDDDWEKRKKDITLPGFIMKKTKHTTPCAWKYKKRGPQYKE